MATSRNPNVLSETPSETNQDESKPGAFKGVKPLKGLKRRVERGKNNGTIAE